MARRWALILSCVAALGFSYYTYSTSPDVVPVHYASRGIPDRWGSRGEVLLIHGCIIGIASALLLAVPEIVRRAPASMLNLPNEDYWLIPERHAAATAKFAVWADAVGVAINALMVGLQLTLPRGPEGTAYAPSALPELLVLGFVLLVLGSCVWLPRTYRLPTQGG